MQKRIESELATLQQMTVRELHERYVAVVGETPRSCNKVWLIRRIAWRIQFLAEGRLNERAQQRAAALAVDAEPRTTPPKYFARAEPSVHKDPRLPLPGGSIARDYKGQRIVVNITSTGFEYAGDRYRSLSAIAKVITGSHVNGFRLFQMGAK